MAKRTIRKDGTYGAPETLEDHLFYGLTLDAEQKAFRDAIWDPDADIIFCNSRAGTGKTLISIATANLLVEYGRYDGIVVVVAPVQEAKTGYLPGTADEKIQEYLAPYYDALETINLMPEKVIIGSDATVAKSGNPYIRMTSHIFMRGCNLRNKVIILDEFQNMYFDEAKKMLTRCHENCKVIVTGHDKQCDLYKHAERSGFIPYLNHFKDQERARICELKTNHRGWISAWADELEI